MFLKKNYPQASDDPNPKAPQFNIKDFFYTGKDYRQL
jgi:hypothetical protein